MFYTYANMSNTFSLCTSTDTNDTIGIKASFHKIIKYTGCVKSTHTAAF